MISLLLFPPRGESEGASHCVMSTKLCAATSWPGIKSKPESYKAGQTFAIFNFFQKHRRIDDVFPSTWSAHLATGILRTCSLNKPRCCSDRSSATVRWKYKPWSLTEEQLSSTDWLFQKQCFYDCFHRKHCSIAKRLGIFNQQHLRIVQSQKRHFWFPENNLLREVAQVKQKNVCEELKRGWTTSYICEDALKVTTRTLFLGKASNFASI